MDSDPTVPTADGSSMDGAVADAAPATADADYGECADFDSFTCMEGELDCYAQCFPFTVDCGADFCSCETPWGTQECDVPAASGCNRCQTVFESGCCEP